MLAAQAAAAARDIRPTAQPQAAHLAVAAAAAALQQQSLPNRLKLTHDLKVVSSSLTVA